MSWVIDSHLILGASGSERNYWSDACYATSDMVTSVTITPCMSRARTQVCNYSIQGNSTTGGGKAEVGSILWQVPVEVGYPRRRCPKRKGSAPGVRNGNLGAATRVIGRGETHVHHIGRIRKGYSYLYRICHPEWRHA